MDQVSNNQVMVIGGDSNFLYLMQRYIGRSAKRIIIAHLNDDFLILTKCEKPVAIILEVDQYETVGWQILRTLKTDPEVGKIPVIVCSWLDNEGLAQAEGANTFLRMPILYADFDTALESILMK